MLLSGLLILEPLENIGARSRRLMLAHKVGHPIPAIVTHREQNHLSPNRRIARAWWKASCLRIVRFSFRISQRRMKHHVGNIHTQGAKLHQRPQRLCNLNDRCLRRPYTRFMQLFLPCEEKVPFSPQLQTLDRISSLSAAPHALLVPELMVLNRPCSESPSCQTPVSNSVTSST